MPNQHVTVSTDSVASSLSATSEQKSSPVLQEIYWFILKDNSTVAEQLCIRNIMHSLEQEGIWFWRDARWKESQNVALQWAGRKRQRYTQKIQREDQMAAEEIMLDWDLFVKFVSPCASMFLKAFSEELVIPYWLSFTTDLTYHFYAVQDVKTGQNAQYIDILKQADPERWGLSVCSIDGQRFSIGDFAQPFSIQSCSKPVTYALCLKEEGAEETEEWIGCEPSGRPFNAQELMEDSCKPYNASVNTGAIMAAGLYASRFPKESWMEVIDRIKSTWWDLCGNDLSVSFSKDTFDSEKATAYNNYAIAYNLKGRRGLPRDIDLLKMLDVYLGCCSIEMTAEAMAVAAATFANGGICPITGREVFRADIVRHVLSETFVCGMYDQSGHFAVNVGIPAKSGVSGILMVIVPNLMGFCTFSPRLNANGNSARGIAFCRRFVNSYRIHLFEPLRAGNTGAKIDPRTNGAKNEQFRVSRLAWALKVGDVYAKKVQEIFVFCLVLAASSTEEGFSSRMLDFIQMKHDEVFQVPIPNSFLEEVMASTKSAASFRILEEMIQPVQILDHIRTIIVFALIDIICLDNAIVETERDVVLRIAILLGVDRNVALMEMDRCERLLQEDPHRSIDFPDALASSSSGALRRRLSRGISMGQDRVVLEMTVDHDILQSRPHRAGLKQASNKVSMGGSGEDAVSLKRENALLRKKVEELTKLLQSSRQRALERSETGDSYPSTKQEI